MRTNLGWGLDPDVTFLNHGSYGACPEPILEVQRSWGSMAALPLSGVSDDVAAEALATRLRDDDRIEVPIGGWPVLAARKEGVEPRVLVRISAQRYNELADYERLAEALTRRLSDSATAS